MISKKAFLVTLGRKSRRTWSKDFRSRTEPKESTSPAKTVDAISHRLGKFKKLK